MLPPEKPRPEATNFLPLTSCGELAQLDSSMSEKWHIRHKPFLTNGEEERPEREPLHENIQLSSGWWLRPVLIHGCSLDACGDGMWIKMADGMSQTDLVDAWKGAAESNPNPAEASAVSWMFLVLCRARDAPAESRLGIMGLCALWANFYNPICCFSTALWSSQVLSCLFSHINILGDIFLKFFSK